MFKCTNKQSTRAFVFVTKLFLIRNQYDSWVNFFKLVQWTFMIINKYFFILFQKYKYRFQKNYITFFLCTWEVFVAFKSLFKVI